MIDPANVPPEALEFLGDYHLATLTTLLPNGSFHSVPVGFTWDDELGLARVITFAPSRKAQPGRRRAGLGLSGGRRTLSVS